MKTAIMFTPRLSASELCTCSALVEHLRECVKMGISERALIEKERIAKLFIRRLTLAPA